MWAREKTLKKLLLVLIFFNLLTATLKQPSPVYKVVYKECVVPEKTRDAEVVPTARCSPRRHLMFLKTHKTGSTTVQNMILRYVDRRNLVLAMPPWDKVTFYDKTYFNHKYVRDYVEEQSYDVITHHLRFNPRQVKKVLKHKDTFYFTILRNPVALMESSYSYFKQDFPAFSLSASLEDFLNYPDEYHDPYDPGNTRVKNPIWFDFGLNNKVNWSPKLCAKAFKAIENIFHLILISEYFDESMILLKEALCWDLDDVVTFKHNSRNEKDIMTVSDDVARKIKKWNSLDWGLYNHFNVTFWAKVEKTIGLARLQEEVAILREKRRELERKCSPDGLVEVDSGIYFKEGLHLMAHNVKSDLGRELKEKCERYFIHPQLYTEILYTKR